jgi:chromosomal replication initiation ATPase DnaA
MRTKLVSTKNVIEADKVISRLKSKEKPGMIVIYGDTGLGKTFYSYNRTFSNGWCYYRIRATETAKSFLQQVYKRLNKIYTGSNEILRGNTAKLEDACIEMFKAMPNQVFAIDEMNLCMQFRKYEIIETIRDLRDEAHAQIILIGEHDTRQKLEAYNPRYFGRCEFVPFISNSAADVALVMKSCSEVEFDKDVYAKVVSKFKGNLRQVENFIQDAEVTAYEMNLKVITMKDTGI